MFGGPQSMEEYAKKKQAAIDRRERFRLKHQVIAEDLQEDETDGENTQYELEYPLETSRVKEPGADTVVGGPSDLQVDYVEDRNSKMTIEGGQGLPEVG
jgi:hypothetical protein